MKEEENQVSVVLQGLNEDCFKEGVKNHVKCSWESKTRMENGVGTTAHTRTLTRVVPGNSKEEHLLGAGTGKTSQETETENINTHSRALQ